MFVLNSVYTNGAYTINIILNYSRDILPDLMSFERLQKRLFTIAIALFLAACTTIAPVQEMSNARQSIKAAKDANAENLASNVLSEAQQRLKSAMRELDAGEYDKARILAIEAKHLALKARQLSSNNKTEKSTKN